MRKGLPAYGGGNRKDKTACKRIGARHHSGDGDEYQIHHHEAGREREKYPDPADEGEGHDA